MAMPSLCGPRRSSASCSPARSRCGPAWPRRTAHATPGWCHYLTDGQQSRASSRAWTHTGPRITSSLCSPRRRATWLELAIDFELFYGGIIPPTLKEGKANPFLEPQAQQLLQVFAAASRFVWRHRAPLDRAHWLSPGGSGRRLEGLGAAGHCAATRVLPVWFGPREATVLRGLLRQRGIDRPEVQRGFVTGARMLPAATFALDGPPRWRELVRVKPAQHLEVSLLRRARLRGPPAWHCGGLGIFGHRVAGCHGRH